MKLNKKIISTSSIAFIVLSIIASQLSHQHTDFAFNITNPSNPKEPVVVTAKDTVIQVVEEADSISDEEIVTSDSIVEEEDSIEAPVKTTNTLNQDEEGTIITKDTVDVMPANYDKFKFFVPKSSHPLIKNVTSPISIQKGLDGRHIAVWQSHGLYYKQSWEKWIWQRSNIFGTREDLFTQSYILPFVVPMLENAGANVLLPRERDTQTTELIVDNDKSSSGSTFVTFDGKNSWQRSVGYGFAHLLPSYRDGENPFVYGTYMQTTSVSSESLASKAEWQPDFPKKDYYAVYISYKSLPNSCNDVIYTVYHTGGKTEFAVNQTMGGSTWIYLGRFLFEKGINQNGKIVLTNTSKDVDKVITADAIKIGGGMGNINRKRSDLISKKVTKTPIKGKKGKKYVYRYKYVKRHGKRKRIRVKVPVKRYKTTVTTSVKHFDTYSTSNSPRFMEGARYWLQWAGVPDSVYSRTKGQDDYSDDFQSRGFWVNYLSGGSISNPGSTGLNIPLDMALALHTDAGMTSDSVIGTLAIHTVRNSQGGVVYKNGVSRWIGRELTDKVQTQVVNDIHQLYDNTWPRRHLWNRSYSESRVPEVPTVLLELLSHQNFADMRYGLDPRFRFDASRSIYKGVLKYLADQNNFDYVVQPLPIEAFSAQFGDSSSVNLKWLPVEDPIEKTASPTGYIVYTCVDGGGFDNGKYVINNKFTRKIEKNKIYGFKVEAVNDGGKSFPSEILSVCKTNNDTTVLIINGFNRISAPATFDDGITAGFNTNWDAGVPYISDYKTTGEQTEFRKGRPFIGDDNPGHGTSKTNLEGTVIAGNTFNYPFIHGKSIQKAGYSFVSCSEKSIENGDVTMSKYNAVDLILGKERQWTTLKKNSTEKVFKTFSPVMRRALVDYADDAGNIFISGANVASDLSMVKQTTPEEYGFLVNFLKLKWVGFKENDINEVTFGSNKYFGMQTLNFYSAPNSDSYYIEAPDAMEPTDIQAIAVGEYKNSGLSAGILYNGSYNICTFGFPFETIKEEQGRDTFMHSTLNFLFKSKKTKHKTK